MYTGERAKLSRDAVRRKTARSETPGAHTHVSSHSSFSSVARLLPPLQSRHSQDRDVLDVDEDTTGWATGWDTKEAVKERVESRLPSNIRPWMQPPSSIMGSRLPENYCKHFEDEKAPSRERHIDMSIDEEHIDYGIRSLSPPPPPLSLSLRMEHEHRVP